MNSEKTGVRWRYVCTSNTRTTRVGWSALPQNYPKGPKIEKIQSRLKCSISLEFFELAWRFQSWPSLNQNSPQKIGVWWVARLNFSISIENFNPSGRSWIFSILGPLLGGNFGPEKKYLAPPPPNSAQTPSRSPPLPRPGDPPPPLPGIFN